MRIKMLKGSVVLFIILLLSVNLEGSGLSDKAASMKSFDYNRSTDFSKIGDMVRNDMYGEMFTTSHKLGEIQKDFNSNWYKNNPVPPFGSAPGVVNSYYKEYENALKEELKEKGRGLYESKVESYLREHLLKENESGEGREQIEQMIAQAKEKVGEDFESVVDGAGGALFQRVDSSEPTLTGNISHIMGYPGNNRQAGRC